MDRRRETPTTSGSLGAPTLCRNPHGNASPGLSGRGLPRVPFSIDLGSDDETMLQQPTSTRQNPRRRFHTATACRRLWCGSIAGQNVPSHGTHGVSFLPSQSSMRSPNVTLIHHRGKKFRSEHSKLASAYSVGTAEEHASRQRSPDHPDTTACYHTPAVRTTWSNFVPPAGSVGKHFYPCSLDLDGTPCSLDIDVGPKWPAFTVFL